MTDLPTKLVSKEVNNFQEEMDRKDAHHEDAR